MTKAHLPSMSMEACGKPIVNRSALQVGTVVLVLKPINPCSLHISRAETSASSTAAQLHLCHCKYLFTEVSAVVNHRKWEYPYQTLRSEVCRLLPGKSAWSRHRETI